MLWNIKPEEDEGMLKKLREKMEDLRPKFQHKKSITGMIYGMEEKKQRCKGKRREKEEKRRRRRDSSILTV